MAFWRTVKPLLGLELPKDRLFWEALAELGKSALGRVKSNEPLPSSSLKTLEREFQALQPEEALQHGRQLEVLASQAWPTKFRLQGQIFGVYQVLFYIGTTDKDPGSTRSTIKTGVWVVRCRYCSKIKVVKQVHLQRLQREGPRSRPCRHKKPSTPAQDREGYRQSIAALRKQNVSYYLWELAKKRVEVRNGKVAFSLTPQDIRVPKTCPVLGCLLEKGVNGKRTPTSPTLVRIDESRGYHPGNVRVVSWEVAQSWYELPLEARVTNFASEDQEAL